MPTRIHFDDIQAAAPTHEDVAAEYAVFGGMLDRASTPGEVLEVIRAWDGLQRRLQTWANLVDLRFNQDTRDEARKAALEHRDQLVPKFTELANALKRRLLQDPRRPELVRELGPQAFSLWEADVLAYDPAIEAEKVRESKLESDYIELLASAEFHYKGEKLNLSTLAKYREHGDRRVWEETERMRWLWFQENQARLDGLFDEQVKLRTAMARKLGFDDYTGLGYQRMKRIDYTRQDVERFRAEVREHVVPLCAELRRRQAEALNVHPLMFWDESVFEPAGNPVPKGGHDWMVERGREMFDEMGSGLGGFFRLMAEADLMDLKSREGKAGGGFCTDFPVHGLPYIFANFNGTTGDVEVFTHEMGHAFQGYQSRHQPLLDYVWPTLEACEIHSMSLEFLTWPQMERFFGEDAERFRRLHLTRLLLFLPYGVAVDHFQHLLYAQPDATPAERHGMWRELERTYLPWRNHGDLAHTAMGGAWQQQGHIYLVPFYYLDYTLAGTCALQFWAKSAQDFQGTLRDYEALCARGGSMPFQELVGSAGLESPFAPGCLERVVDHAREALGWR